MKWICWEQYINLIKIFLIYYLRFLMIIQILFLILHHMANILGEPIKNLEDFIITELRKAIILLVAAVTAASDDISKTSRTEQRARGGAVKRCLAQWLAKAFEANRYSTIATEV